MVYMKFRALNRHCLKKETVPFPFFSADRNDQSKTVLGYREGKKNGKEKKNLERMLINCL